MRFRFSAIVFLCVTSVGVYTILGAGWIRNRKYGRLGSIRAVAQSIRYEVSLTLIVILRIFFYRYIMGVLKLSVLGSFLFIAMILLAASGLAETNRAPFDFSEGESELVSGYNTEYSSVPFLIFFLAEYMAILFISSVISMLFNMTTHLD